MKISCIIVEDEPASRDILKQYMARVPELELIRICEHALEANEVLASQAVRLMFLDINIPGISGISFYKTLTNPPDVIFTTAYPEYALEGFEVNAVDYLVKPFPFERFLKAVNKVKDKLNEQYVSSEACVFLKAEKKIHKVKLREILFVEAMGDYVKVHLADKMMIVHETLQGLQNQLPANLFIRIHKSFLISLERVEQIDGNRIIIAGTAVPLGQTYKARFLKLIGRVDGLTKR